MVLYTIGYSPFFEKGELVNFLKKKDINFLVDIRTFPYSKTFPIYDEKEFKKDLKKEGIMHTFLGNYIGGLVVKNRVKKGISKVEDILDVGKFKNGMNTLYKILKENKTVVMCAEKDPMDCHRFLAVGYLMEKIAKVNVINLFKEKEEKFNETLNRWKTENKLELLEYTDEQIIKERLNLLYKIQNKREKKEIKIPKSKILFE